jgi:predicted heme/steroid binding protein
MQMDWEYNIARGRNLLIARGTGKFSATSFERMLFDILFSESWMPGMNALVDHSALDLSYTFNDEIKKATEIYKKYDSRIGRGRIALVLGREEDFDKSCLFVTLLGPDVLATVKSFQTTEEARQWLADDEINQS